MSANIAETFELLFDKNNKVAYKALQELQKESAEMDCVYPYMDRLSDMLDSDNSYVRTRGLAMQNWSSPNGKCADAQTFGLNTSCHNLMNFHGIIFRDYFKP